MSITSASHAFDFVPHPPQAAFPCQEGPQKRSDKNKSLKNCFWKGGPAEADKDLWFGLVWFRVSSLFDIQRLLERKEIYSTHVRLQRLWHFNTILLLEVFQNTTQCPLSGSQRRIEHMNKLLGLLVILWVFHTLVMLSVRNWVKHLYLHWANIYKIHVAQNLTFFCP